MGYPQLPFFGLVWIIDAGDEAIGFEMPTDLLCDPLQAKATVNIESANKPPTMTPKIYFINQSSKRYLYSTLWCVNYYNKSLCN